MSYSISKKDIEILTKQVCIDKQNVLESLDREHLDIKSSMLYDNLCAELNKKQTASSEIQSSENINDDPLLLDDCEQLLGQFDKFESKFVQTKTLHTLAGANSASTISARSKDAANAGMKRYGSVTNLNKTSMMRTSSLLDLSTRDGFVEPKLLAPRAAPQPASVLAPENCIEPNPNHTLSVSQLNEFNVMKLKLAKRISSIDNGENYSVGKIRDRFIASIERMKSFFDAVEQIKFAESNESTASNSLECLDRDLCHLLETLSEVSKLFNNIFEKKNTKSTISLFFCLLRSPHSIVSLPKIVICIRHPIK